MSLLLDCISICSIVGIWPRYIEPRRLCMTHLDWKLSKEQAHLEGLKIVHISDLHFHSKLSARFLDKIAKRVMQQSPDLILFTGDFICYSQLTDREGLASFLKKLHAPHGCYCILGNHDYSRYVTLSREGVYDLLPPPTPAVGIMRGLQTLFSPTKKREHRVSERAQEVPLHSDLLSILNETNFILLENRTISLPIGLNLTGLGDHALGRCLPKKAFVNYNPDLPGIVMTHNPDTFPLLFDYPGEWLLAGHTHGEQIHFPFCRPLSRKLARLQYPLYSRGHFRHAQKELYVSRGLGGHKPFRFCSPPEIVLLRGVR